MGVVVSAAYNPDLRSRMLKRIRVNFIDCAHDRFAKPLARVEPATADPTIREIFYDFSMIPGFLMTERNRAPVPCPVPSRSPNALLNPFLPKRAEEECSKGYPPTLLYVPDAE